MAVGNAHIVFEQSYTPLLIGELYFAYPGVSFPPVVASGRSVSSDLAVPAGSVVGSAVVRVTAAAPASARISDIATVRPAAGNPTQNSTAMIIDFGVMRNVSGIAGPVGITRVSPWLGTSFDTSGFRESSSANVALQELQTERLLVEFVSSVSVPSVGTGTIVTSTPPADLVLEVAGTRAWFHQGPVPAGFVEDIDITAQVQAAVSGGVSPVPVVLTSRIAGSLGLAPLGDVQFLRTQVVEFEQGDTTIVDVPEEGVVDVPLPLPVASESWTLHRVVGTIATQDRGPERVDPAVGPPPLAGAELTLDADRRLVVRLPAAGLAAFERLAAVRIRLHAGAGGIGVVGGLLGGTPLAPGGPAAGGEIVEVAVEPSTAANWVTLRFAKPVALPYAETLWLSVAATRGRALLGLADPPAGPDAHDEVAMLRRVAPNGVAKPLSSPIGLRTDALALRLVGTAPRGRPIDLVSVGLAALGGDAAGELPTVAEPSDGLDRFVRALVEPAGAGGLALRLTVTAPTRLTIGPVVVAYQDGPP